MYQRKYSTELVFMQDRQSIVSLTWLVQTLLKVTKANVWANIVFGRSFFASASGIKKALRSSCGRNAKRSSPEDNVVGSKFVGVGDDFR